MRARPVMNNATRWIISFAIGAAIEGALFVLCILTSRDFTHEGPDTSLSVFFGFASMWAGYLFRFVALPQDSAVTHVVVFVVMFGLPTLIYCLLIPSLGNNRTLRFQRSTGVPPVWALAMHTRASVFHRRDACAPFFAARAYRLFIFKRWYYSCTLKGNVGLSDGPNPTGKDF